MSRNDEPDLTTRVCAARLHDTRRRLYREGEITVSGLRRLDEAIGLGEADTYRLVRSEAESEKCELCGRAGKCVRFVSSTTGRVEWFCRSQSEAGE